MVNPENKVKSQIAITARDDVSIKTVLKPEPKTVEKPTPKPVVKPTVISESDLVGQILLQGFASSGKQAPTQWPLTSGNTLPAKTEQTATAVRVYSVNTQKPNTTSTSGKQASSQWPLTSRNTLPAKTERPATAVRMNPVKPNTTSKIVSDKATSNETKKATTPNNLKATSKHRTALTNVSWNMNKIVTPRASEKRPRDVLDERVQDEMNAKRQRLTQWLDSCVSIILFEGKLKD